MKIFHSIDAFKATQKTIATIGTFDGVHIGHRKIIDKLVLSAKNSGAESLILTFFPHPRMVLQEQSEIQLLNTIAERTALLEQTGLENLIIHPFDKAFSRLTAEEFVKEILVDRFRIEKIVIGHDHRFGRNRTADINDLIEYGEKYGFQVEQISAQEVLDVSVSSTKIRAALSEGNIVLANQYLGQSYFLTGTVQQGRQLGRTIGFPTANLKIPETYKLIPKNGVYIVSSLLGGRLVYGMMNIGTKPTVGGDTVSIEVYYLDFDGDLYGQQIQVNLLAYIREEQKFASFDLLKAQIENDKNTTISFLKKL